MVEQNKVRRVVTLCHKIGGSGNYWDNSDACQYFPAAGEIQIDDFSIKLLSEKNEGFTTKRTLQVTKSGQASFECEHVHFQGWPDFQVPKKDSLVDFTKMINESADFVINQHQALVK